jgi:hypothetical protein
MTRHFAARNCWCLDGILAVAVLLGLILNAVAG